MKYSAITSYFVLLAICLMAFAGCQKMERPDGVLIPDDTARMNSPLQMYLSFEGNANDSAQYAPVITSGDFSFAEGPQGQAYQGAAGAYLQYSSPSRLIEMESFTVSFWMNTEKHNDGAQAIFMLPNTSDFWGNMFATIESNNNPNLSTMEFKFNFWGNWIEFNGNNGLDRLPDMYGNWNHLAFTYNGESSVFAAYLNGERMALPENVTNRTRDGQPLGPINFENTARFIIGGFQQHAGHFSDLDGWMNNYTGKLDQFRLYIEPLSESEIQTLYQDQL